MGKCLNGFSFKFQIWEVCAIAVLEGKTYKHLQLKSSKANAMQKYKQRGFSVISLGISSKANCDQSDKTIKFVLVYHDSCKFLL